MTVHRVAQQSRSSYLVRCTTVEMGHEARVHKLAVYTVSSSSL